MSTSDTATTSALPVLDGPTLWAALTTVVFAVLAGVVIGNLPQDGSLGGALDALKNIIYMLTVPLFDLSRRAFSRRAIRSAAPAGVAPTEGPNILRTAFVSALAIFVLVELLAWLTGFAMGSTCLMLGHSFESGTFGQCLGAGVSVFATVVIAPIMIALGATAGWMWRASVRENFWLALAIFAGVVTGLFALDYAIMLQQSAVGTEVVRDAFAAIGPVRQVGAQVAILTFSLLLGYGARRLWQALTGDRT